MQHELGLSRRDLLVVGGAAASGAVLSGCGAVSTRFLAPSRQVSLPKLKDNPDRRRVDRLTFGATDLDLVQIKELGHEKYVDLALEAKVEEHPAFLASLARFDAIRTESAELMDLPKGRVIEQLQGAAIVRAVYSKNQLFERMVDFWSNHFNVFSGKNDAAFYKGVEEEKVIRAHALGKFSDLLSGIAHSPAMLMFLDNNRNISGHPNENYARELLELHTMGVHGGYTQKDIQEVARCFTGWGVELRFLKLRKGQFRFDPDKHDKGAKTVLGKTIPAGGGESDGKQVLDLVTLHPSTAKFIAQKMCRYFIGAEDPALVEKAAKAFLDSKGDIRATVRPILTSSQMLAADPVIRRPFEFMAASLRLTNAMTDGNVGIQHHLRAMGQPVYEWPMPDGYPVKTQNWVGSMLPRWNFARELCHGGIRGTSVNTSQVKLDGKALSKEELALYLSSPEFQWM